MAKTPTFVRGRGGADLLSDRDWIAIIDALLQDKTDASQKLAKMLLAKTKQGRHVRVLQMLYKKGARIQELVKALKVSRRTVFRYLNGLEDYCIELKIDDNFRYTVDKVPASFNRVLASRKK